VIATPNLAAGPLLPITRAPSPTQSDSSEEDVEILLDPKRPVTPPSTVLPLPPPNTPLWKARVSRSFSKIAGQNSKLRFSNMLAE